MGPRTPLATAATAETLAAIWSEVTAGMVSAEATASSVAGMGGPVARAETRPEVLQRPVTEALGGTTGVQEAMPLQTVAAEREVTAVPAERSGLDPIAPEERAGLAVTAQEGPQRAATAGQVSVVPAEVVAWRWRKASAAQAAKAASAIPLALPPLEVKALRV